MWLKLLVPIAPTKPSDLTLVPFRCTEGRLSISTILQVSVPICSVEDRDDAVHYVESEIREAFELLTWDGPGLKPAGGGKADDVDHQISPDR